MNTYPTQDEILELAGDQRHVSLTDDEGKTTHPASISRAPEPGFVRVRRVDGKYGAVEYSCDAARRRLTLRGGRFDA